MRQNHSLLNGAHPLKFVRAIRRDGRWLQSYLRAQHRSHQANWPLEGSLGNFEEAFRSAVPVPRSAAHGLHADARSRGTPLRDFGHHGLQRLYTVRMVKRYGHAGQEAQRQAVAALSGANFRRMGHRFYDFEPTAPDRRLEFIHNVPGCLSRDRFFGL